MSTNVRSSDPLYIRHIWMKSEVLNLRNSILKKLQHTMSYKKKKSISNLNGKLCLSHDVASRSDIMSYIKIYTDFGMLRNDAHIKVAYVWQNLDVFTQKK